MLQLLPTQFPAWVRRQAWPLQMGQPLKEAKYSQQQCKCNTRQLGSEPRTPPNTQMS